MNKEKYQEGLMDVVQFLTVDLREFLKDEGRFKYRVERYWSILSELDHQVNKQVTLEDIDIYGRVLYLIKKPIMIEYKFLRKKSMSPADCLISIIHKMLEVSEGLGEYRFTEQHREIKKIIDSLWDNIRHKGKYSKLFKIEETILDIIKEEKIGKLSLDELDMYELEHPKQKERTIYGVQTYTETSSEKEIQL